MFSVKNMIHILVRIGVGSVGVYSSFRFSSFGKIIRPAHIILELSQEFLESDSRIDQAVTPPGHHLFSENDAKTNRL